MVKIFDSTKTEKGPASFSSGGKKIRCPHCDGVQFEAADILLNTPGLTFFGLDWANRTAATLACTRCGFLLWFVMKPQREEKG